jgi:parvulin-like peptidyl-prolyl isomerase
MLRFFRSGGVGQFVVGAVVFTIILVFAVEFRAGRGPTAGLKRHCAVEYRGTCLDQKDFFAAYGLVVPRGVDAAAAKRLGLRRRVLEGLVERELLIAQAHELGLNVSEETINGELEAGRAHVSIPAAESAETSARLGLCRIDKSGSMCERGTDRMVRQLHVRRTPTEPFDYKLYEREIRVLSNRGPREFKEMQGRELLAARMRSLVRGWVRVSAAELRFAAERAVIRSAVLTRDWFAKYAIDQSQSTIDKWAFENRAQVDPAVESEKANVSTGCTRLREIVVPVASDAFEDERSPAKQKIEDARARVARGEEFGVVAREVSSGPSSWLGGDVGCLSKSYGLGADELIKAAEALKPGELSSVVETPRGYHVIQVIERVDAAKAEAALRQHIARNLYAHFAADEAERKFADDLIARAKGGQKLEDAVRELTESTIAAVTPEKRAKPGANKAAPAQPFALTAPDRPRFDISAPFTRSGNPLPDIEPKQPVAPLAFELAKADAVATQPVETATGLVVIQLKELTQPEPAELADLESAFREIKADAALTRYVADLRRAAGTRLKVDASFAEDHTKSSDDE